jgi:hypothetical protein
LDLNVVELLLLREWTFGQEKFAEGTLVGSRCGADRREDLREPPAKGSDLVWNVEEEVVVEQRGKALWTRGV